MKERIFAVVAEILKLEEEVLRENYDNKDIWDSVQRVEILFAMEDEFEVLFDEDELSALTTPQELSEAVLRKAVRS